MNNYPVFNPMYNNPTPVQYQQMLQPMYQMNQPQPQQQHYALPGKMVEGIDVFKTTDIPMDGNVYYFPKADGTEIYTKRWLQNGTTEQLVYKVEKVSEENKTDPFMDKLNGIEDKITALEELLLKPVKTTAKKEG